jgi:flagellar hook-length control protein FliK
MTAELHLNPADMGPVQVRIEMNGSSAQVNFVAQHWETRQIIEASFASLSNALQEAGIQLSGSGVSDQAPQQQASSGFGARGEDAPRPWQSPPSPQRPAPDKPELTDLEMSNAASWSAPRAGQSASGLDLYA